MLNSRPIERSTLVSTKTSNGGIKRDVEGQGSTLKPLRMNQQGLSVMMEYDAPTIRRPITPKRPLGNSMGNPKDSKIRGFNKEEIERLRNLLSSLEKPNGSCSFAQTSKFPTSYALSASTMILGS
ncbi:hypothetical protein CK203_100566 [Vitis vinifera]|uniref:Uncharacterized protein n=1 Tax=Vitis vinifera TaxID=29760 RepID=A0A438CZF5_VITVI|nr:hypothetical protein CK203_100566 [Vitis vinifera]